MKQSYKYKQNKNYIKGQPRHKRKQHHLDNCYRCGYAGLMFDKKELRFRPYCFYRLHRGFINYVDMTKWNMNLKFREEKYETNINQRNGRNKNTWKNF